MAEDKAADRVEAADRATNVFISYSRRDGDTAERLRDRLIGQGFQAYLDKHDIAAGEDWRARLGGLIESADTMVFLISPDSIASQICDWEVNHAELLGKRVIPVVCREPDNNTVPARLQRLNYVFMRSAEEERSELARLENALAVDIVWIRQHTRYSEMAVEWDRAGRPGRLLLRGTGIDDAEKWRDSRPPTAPALTDAQSAFVAASRKAATRRQRAWIAGTSVIAVAAVALSFYAFMQQQEAEARRKEVTQVLATSDFRQGTQLVDTDETTPDGIAFLSRAARSGDERARTRLWTMMQQRSFWLPAGNAGPAASPLPAEGPAVPDAIRQLFAQVEMNGQMMEPEFIGVSGDGAHVVTVAGNTVEDIPLQVKVWKSDGTPITDWFQPPYTGDMYLWKMRGFFSYDGRHLAVELLGWRQSASLIVYDLQAMKELKGEIAVAGLLPQEQLVQFNTVAFVERPAKAGGDKETYLLSGSAKGDATAHRVFDDDLFESARNQHRAPVTLVAIDADAEWLMSASADRVVHVSKMTEGVPVGNAIQADAVVTGLERIGKTGLVVETADGKRQRFELRAPVQPTATKLPAEMTAGEPCLKSNDVSEGNAVLDHPSGMRIEFSGTRQVKLSRPGSKPVLSPAFDADVALVCASASGDLAAVTTANFRTEIWTSDFSRRLGPPLDERRFFKEQPVPEKTDWVKLSADGKKALIRSSFWDAPNMDIFWINLWDVDSGLPLMDRTRFADDNLTEGAVQSAAIDPGTGRVVYLTGSRPVRSVQVDAPTQVKSWLPDFAEAATGLSINPQGLPVRIEDRATRLKDGIGRLDGLGQ